VKKVDSEPDLPNNLINCFLSQGTTFQKFHRSTRTTFWLILREGKQTNKQT